MQDRPEPLTSASKPTSTAAQVFAGLAYGGVTLLVCLMTQTWLFIGPVVFLGVAAAEIHLRWRYFFLGAVISIALSPFVFVVMCFAALSKL